MSDELKVGDRKVFLINSISPVYRLINSTGDARYTDRRVTTSDVEKGAIVVLEVTRIHRASLYTDVYWREVSEDFS